MDYEKMLKKGMDALPKKTSKQERFEIPRVRGHIQGNRTVISNFYQVAQTLGRTPEHLLKYVLKELATPGDLTKTALIIGSKISAHRINEKIEKYTELFVLCPECGKPDTTLKKEKGITFKKCLACGARHPVLTKI